MVTAEDAVFKSSVWTPAEPPLAHLQLSGGSVRHLLYGPLVTAADEAQTGDAEHLYDPSVQGAFQHQLLGGGSNMTGYPLPVFVARARANVSATVFAPGGDVVLGPRGSYRGAVLGRTVVVGPAATVRVDSAL